MIVCPRCRGRATKLFSISSGFYTCQQCDHQWTSEDFTAGPKRWTCKNCGKARRRYECLSCGNQEPLSDESRVSGLIA